MHFEDLRHRGTDIAVEQVAVGAVEYIRTDIVVMKVGCPDRSSVGVGRHHLLPLQEHELRHLVLRQQYLQYPIAEPLVLLPHLLVAELQGLHHRGVMGADSCCRS